MMLTDWEKSSAEEDTCHACHCLDRHQVDYGAPHDCRPFKDLISQVQFVGLNRAVIDYHD